MRHLASGVWGITAESQDGERVAMTASSVTSVSDNPPSLLVCVNKSTTMDSVLAKTAPFTVNILGKDQEAISNNCASPGEAESRFATGNWEKDAKSGLYYLRDALSVFICEKRQVVSYGTHSIYIGNVVDVKLGGQSSSPLVYARGAYHYL